jgi:phospholipid/cholesterol/gamma-HCH transport system ATP-binding protein
MRGFSGCVAAGELVEVRLRRHQQPRDLVSALLGIRELDAGAVRFQGQGWTGNDYKRHFLMRSRIGRVFSGSAWISNMTVSDNLLLPMLHHGRSEDDARGRIEEWTIRLAGRQARVVQRAMRRRPSAVEPSMLQACQLIRAVCNAPAMLILERPFQYLNDAVGEAFVSAVDQLRRRGVAVLLFTGDRNGSLQRFGELVTRWELSGNALVSSAGATR